MELYLRIYLKAYGIITLLLCALFINPLFSQESQSPYSVFGPPRPAEWEFQAATSQGNPDSFNESSWYRKNFNGFSWYRKNQRQKTHFMSLYQMEDGADSQLRLSAGTVLFPYNDDDRVQLELGGSVSNSETRVSEIDFMTRLTLRPLPWLWVRAGYEGLDNGDSETRKLDHRLDEQTQYFALKISSGSWQFTGAAGAQSEQESTARLLGGGVYKMIGQNYFVFAGRLLGFDADESVRTLAFGRWAPFRPDGKPSMVYIWKHKNNYDFQLGALFLGGSNLFVRPAALGMTQGVFLSNLGLTENSALRRRQLMAINDESRNSNLSVFYVTVDQDIELIPGQLNNHSVRAVKFFKLFPKFGQYGFSTPIAGFFYNHETIPVIDFSDTYFSGQVGVYYKKRHLLNLIYRPDEHEWTLAYSFFRGGR
jgi:hypothetical protein